MSACRDLFQASVTQMNEREERIYARFADLSRFIQEFRQKGLAGGEVSRCNQYLSKMLVAFENVKHIYQYRTPKTPRAYGQFFIYVVPILCGPYFAQISTEGGWAIELIMPIVFSVVLVSLENIQEHLENPFDLVGEDDVVINAEKFVAKLGV